MHLNPKTTAIGAGVLLTLALLSFPALFKGGRNAAGRGDRTESSTGAGSPRAGSVSGGQIPASGSDSAGSAADDRRAALEKWANSIELSALAGTLESIQTGSPDGAAKAGACAALLSSWTKRDMAGAVAWFGTRPVMDTLHQQARDIIARDMAAHDPALQLSRLQTFVSPSVRGELYNPFFRAWTATDPAAAAGMIRSLAGTGGQDAGAWNDLAGQVAAVWAARDLKTSLAWVQSLPKGDAKARALEQISYQWTESDPRAAAEYAAISSNPQLLKNVTARWAANDLQAAAEWVGKLPHDETGVTAATTLATAWADRDPVAAASYVAGLPAGDMQDKAATALVSSWASKAPEQAAQWVNRYPESRVRELAMEQLMDAWAGVDPVNAAQWLQSLPQTQSRDMGVSAFSSALGATDPESAFQWAQSISDQIMRNEQLKNMAAAWLKSDPAAAQKGIAGSNLPSYLKTDLLPASTR